MVLSDLGANVVRIDRPQPMPYADGLGGDPTGRSKRSIALDLKHPEGLEVARRLAAGCDILVEGLRPGVAERLGLGPEPCLRANPALVYGRMTGWGQDGPLAHSAGHDLNYLALTGVLGAIGPRAHPVPPLNLIGDYGGGALFLVVGVLGALLHARVTGVGQVVDAAIIDGVGLLAAIVRGGLAAGNWVEQRQANLLDGGAPFYRTYRTADGGHVAVGALEPRFFASLLDGLEIDPASVPAQYDRSGWHEVELRLATKFATADRQHWESVFAGTDACVTPVLSWNEALDHPHTQARAAFTHVEGVMHPAPAPRFSVTTARTPGPGPAPASDTVALLAELGYSEAEIGKLRRIGAAFGSSVEE
jgi:alpha-methylacyl-CoA racemase